MSTISSVFGKDRIVLSLRRFLCLSDLPTGSYGSYWSLRRWGAQAYVYCVTTVRPFEYFDYIHSFKTMEALMFVVYDVFWMSFTSKSTVIRIVHRSRIPLFQKKPSIVCEGLLLPGWIWHWVLVHGMRIKNHRIRQKPTKLVIKILMILTLADEQSFQKISDL